jgi:CelD/BcsL family acetyltransferase involved in cellulose biosynthesis
MHARNRPTRTVPTSRVHVRKQSHDFERPSGRRRLAGACGATRRHGARRPTAGKPADRGCGPAVGGDRRRDEPALYGDLGEVEREWKAFERRADCTVFQTFDWLAKWQRHIGKRRDTTPAIVLGGNAEGHLLFILQLAIEARGMVRCLTWLGSELCDYNAPLLAKDFSAHVSGDRFVALWRDVIARLRRDPRFSFELVDLQKMPETVGAQRNPFLDLPVLAHPSGAYVATLDRDWERFYAAKRSSSTRKRERRQLKHLAEFGEVRFVDVQDRADIEHTLATLISQKSRSFARMGVEDIFARPGYRDFFLDVATDLNVRALAHVSRLDVGATTAATNLGLRFRDCYYLVLSSYHDGEFSRFGPGRAHLNELIRHAIERGFHRFDFTVGDEPYKRDWSDTELRLQDYLAAVTWRGGVVVALTAAYRRTKRVIKQSPTLWRAFSKARGLAGSLSPR